MNRQTASQTHQEAAPHVAAGILQRKCDCGQHTVAGGECDECGKKQLSLQRVTQNPERGTRSSGGVPPIIHEVLRSPGQPLDDVTRAFFEPRFGHDFSKVRVHTDTRAAESAEAVNALAYTVGRDIVFGNNNVDSATRQGREHLAHELAHVVQQGMQTPSRLGALGLTPSSGASEWEAHSAAAAVASGGAFRPQIRSGMTLARQQTPGGGRTPPSPAPPAPAPSACTPPTSIRLVSSNALAFPGYLTGGGICAVMEAQPAVSNLCPSVPEQVTSAGSGTTCPTTLITGGLCAGSSTFTIGRNQVSACASVSMPPSGFVDRHTIQLQSVSVLHDSTRNPAGLNSCAFTCDQQYFAGSSRSAIGRFQIRYDLTKGRRGTENITLVTATKTAAP